ncbi:MAG: ubiquinol-cytochrome c reductase iron-sulfur subunit [Pseudomonadota bacterium]
MSQTSTEGQPHGEGPEDESRRDFLFIATGAAGAVTMGAIVWPLIDQMNPSADVLALASIEVDVGGVSEGSEIRVMWRGKPVFIRHRTEDEIARARADDAGTLPDPATDAQRTLDDAGKWLVQVGVCTHLGCVPLGNGAGDYQGWFCPCHGSHYDIAGRIRKGPAPKNLEVPPAEFLDETVIKLG